MMKLAIRGAVAALGLLVLASGAAYAQDAAPFPEELNGMVGDWVIEQEDETLPTCAVTLSQDVSVGGYSLAEPVPCAAPFPTADQLKSWNLDDDGSVLFLDAQGQTVLRFLEDEDGLFATDESQPTKFYLLQPIDDGDTGGEIDAAD